MESTAKRRAFGSLKVNLAESLRLHDVVKLATYFGLSTAFIDNLQRSNSPGLDLVGQLEAEALISANDISQLLDALRECHLGGVVDKVQQWYPSNVSSQPLPDVKKEAFINELKIAYENVCATVKPVPYIREELYSVHEVYVEGGMEVLVGPGGAEHKKGWSSLESYNEILQSPTTDARRKIIEGEPGYGKTTLTLQYLHDWCSSNAQSPLKHVEILLYLKFRQLHGVKSIYQAIKELLLPKDTTITARDIQNIIQSSKSVVAFFDAYDEYPDKNDKSTDFSHIMSMKMFQNIDVIITTRKCNLPVELTRRTKRIRLTGFGKQNRRNYILKVVAPNDNSVADQIEEHLKKNPILGDLCEVPLFFTMVAHIAHEREHLEIFSTATRFFYFIVECFHSHMRNKDDALSDEMSHKFKADHSALDFLAFEGLCRKEQQLSWQKSVVDEKVGHEFCQYYVNMGMLVQEEVLDVARRPGITRLMWKQLRYPHKVFCEWYASYHLVRLIVSGTEDIQDVLASIDPFDLQYLYRFTCGLDKHAAETIIKYLQKTKDGRQFAVLCMLEQEEKSEQLLQTVKDLVSGETTYIDIGDTKLLQRSTIQILDVASTNQIPVFEVYLKWCFRGLDGDDIKLDSGLTVASLSSVEKISVKGREEQLSEKDVTGLLKFGLQSKQFKGLWLGNCVMPSSVDPSSIPNEAQTRQVKVISSGEARGLDLTDGKWKKPEDISTIAEMCSGPVVISNTSSTSVQSSVVELLGKASKRNLPIFRVTLSRSFRNIGEDGNMTLSSGIFVPILSSLQTLHIQTEYGQKFNEQEVNDILNYAQHSKQLQEVRLSDCVLPSAIQLQSSLAEMSSRNIGEARVVVEDAIISRTTKVMAEIAVSQSV